MLIAFVPPTRVLGPSSVLENLTPQVQPLRVPRLAPVSSPSGFEGGFDLLGLLSAAAEGAALIGAGIASLFDWIWPNSQRRTLPGTGFGEYIAISNDPAGVTGYVRYQARYVEQFTTRCNGSPWTPQTFITELTTPKLYNVQGLDMSQATKSFEWVCSGSNGPQDSAKAFVVRSAGGPYQLGSDPFFNPWVNSTRNGTVVRMVEPLGFEPLGQPEVPILPEPTFELVGEARVTALGEGLSTGVAPFEPLPAYLPSAPEIPDAVPAPVPAPDPASPVAPSAPPQVAPPVPAVPTPRPILVPFLPFPVPGPGELAQPDTQLVTSKGQVVAKPPPPVTKTPIESHFLKDGTEIRSPGPGPSPRQISQELGRLEKKAELDIDRNQVSDGLNIGALADILDTITDLADLLSLIQLPFGGGEYLMPRPCGYDEVGNQLEPLKAEWPAGIGMAEELNLKIDALAKLLEFAKEVKQPICTPGRAQGQGVTIVFEEI